MGNFYVGQYLESSFISYNWPCAFARLLNRFQSSALALLDASAFGTQSYHPVIWPRLHFDGTARGYSTAQMAPRVLLPLHINSYHLLILLLLQRLKDVKKVRHL